MNTLKSIEDLKHTINILKGNIRLFHEGNISVYRVIATQLRLLLCDKDNTLLQRMIGAVKLHPIIGYLSNEYDNEWKMKYGWSLKDKLVFQSPASIEFDGQGNSKIVKLFDEYAEPIALDEWLDQDLFNKNITIRELIKSVADKTGAHSDKNYNDTLRFTKSVKLIDEDIHIKYIVAIGEYVLHIISNLAGNTIG